MPKIVDHDERRREFASAAMRVAIKGGVNALTIRAVSREACCSTGALAHYFKTKDDLLIAVQRSAGEKSLARIDDCFARYEGRALLEAVILSVLPLDEERRGEWRLWLAYFARAAEVAELADVQRDSYEGWYSRLRDAHRSSCPTERPMTRSEINVATDATMTLVQGLGVLGMYEPSGITTRRQRQLVRLHLERWVR